jgi:hypothetical protein
MQALLPHPAYQADLLDGIDNSIQQQVSLKDMNLNLPSSNSGWS